jgi:hypothetical protein
MGRERAGGELERARREGRVEKERGGGTEKETH